MAIEHPEFHRLLRSLGLSRQYLGYRYLLCVLVQAREDPARLRAPTKLLYPAAMKKYGASLSGVDSALRTAAKVCWREGDPALTGRASPDQPPPTVSNFLRLLARLGGFGDES